MTFPAAGQYTIGLRVTDNHGTSRTASTTVTAGTTPVVTINAPTASTQWSVGETINFSGYAVDGQTLLPGSSMDWELYLHHCYTPSDCHIHHVQDFPARAGGSFSAPDHGYPAKLELRLTAHNSSGVPGTSSVTIDPSTTTVSAQTSPQGLQMAVGSTVAPAPLTLTVIVGSSVVITAPSPQKRSDGTWVFDHWSDGGAGTHTVVAGTGPSSFTATYRGPK